MKIILDLQAAQSESRQRGIGRYSLSLAQAIIRNAGCHQVYVSLNHVFPGTIEPLKQTLRELLPEDHILVYRTLPQAVSRNRADFWRNRAGELIRESFLAAQRADIVHTSSMFEGWADHSVASNGRLPGGHINAVTLYDLIPYLHPDRYLTSPEHYAWYMAQLESLRRTDILLAISDYTRDVAVDLLRVPNTNVATIYADADPMFRRSGVAASSSALQLQQLGVNTPFIMYTGVISSEDPRKNCRGLLQAYARLDPALRERHQLVLVGRYNAYDHRDLHEEASQLGIESGQLVFTDYIEDDMLVLFYSACRLFVFPSLEEGFGLPALEAMRCGAAVIGSNCSSIPEVIGEPTALFDPLNIDDMAQTMKQALTCESMREKLLLSSAQQAEKFCWDRSAQLALAAFEQALQQRNTSNVSLAAHPSASMQSSLSSDLLDGLRKITLEPPSEQDMLRCAQAISENQPLRLMPCLYLDISILIRDDAKTGIQRVVRSLIAEFFANPVKGFDLKVIYRDALGCFRAAESVLPLVMNSHDAVIDVNSGDIYLCLDLDLDGIVVHERNDFLHYQQQRGLKVYYMVYDLLPVLQSDHFHSGIKERFPKWLNYIAAEADGLICISKAVADELKLWLENSPSKRLSPIRIGYFHLGADIEASVPSLGLPKDAEHILHQLRRRPSILMVGTIEPRKRQQQVLQAMDLLWKEGHDVNLVLVGKSGWQMEDFEKRLDQHPQRGDKLLWLRGISDEMLQQVYNASSLLLSASTGEGFGLPLIEAAQHGLPILARDIPVFREVAAEHAMYFSGDRPEDIAVAILKWLKLHEADEVPQSTEMGWLSWEHSAAQLRQLVFGQRDWYTSLRLQAEATEEILN